MTDQKQHSWVYEDNGVIVYRASSLYSCIRSMVACRTGETTAGPHANLRAAMDASSGLEDELLRRTGAELSGELIWQQKEVELHDFRIPDVTVQIRGHIDAMHQPSDTIIEAKALGDVLFDKFDTGYEIGGVLGALDRMGNLGTKYKWQGAIYGHATGRKVRFAIGHKVKVTEQIERVGEELYEKVSYAIEELIVTEPIDPETLVPLTDIMDRIRVVEDFASRDELPDCDMGCRESDPFGEVHLFASAKQGDERLEDLLASYDEVSAAIKDAQDRKDEIRDILIEEYGIGKHVAGPFSMNIIKVQSSRFDTKWLKKTMPDVYDQGLVPSESIRVNVTNPSKKGQRDDSAEG